MKFNSVSFSRPIGRFVRGSYGGYRSLPWSLVGHPGTKPSLVGMWRNTIIRNCRADLHVSVCMPLRLGVDFVTAISAVNSGVDFADSGRSGCTYHADE